MTANFSILSPATDITSVRVGQGGDVEYLVIRNLRVQSGDVDLSSLVPRSGLKMWLGNQMTLGGFAEHGIEPVGQWTDLSGNGNHAVQNDNTKAPTAYDTQNGAGGFSESGAIGDGPTCQPAVNFNGQGQFLNFNLPIQGFSEMTIFLVAAPDADGTGGTVRSESAAIFWNESAAWGSTHLTPFQTIVSARFGTTRVNNNLVFVRPVDMGGDYTVTTFEKRNTTESLWVDGQPVLNRRDNSPIYPESGVTASWGAVLTTLTGRALSPKCWSTIARSVPTNAWPWSGT